MDFKEILIPISELHLDSNNPRLSKKGMSEEDIMRELFDRENVIEVIESICRRGYLPNERLFVVKEKGKNIVVEGNRRLCALRLLKQPSLIPELEKKVTGVIVTKGNPQIGKKIAIVVMGREDAKEIILYRHTTNPVKRWGLINQAKFYRELMDNGESVESIVDKYGEMRSHVERFLELEQLHYVAGKMPLDDDTLAVVNDSKKFSLSTLERIATKPQIKTLLGISFDENVRIKGSIPKGEFVKGYKKIVSDIANKVTDTRKLNDEEDIQSYLNKFSPSETPDASKKGQFTVNDFMPSHAPKFVTPFVPTPPKKQVQYCVIPQDVEFKLKNEALKELFKELQKISYNSRPNAVAISFRSFLERAIHQYLLDKGFKDEIIALEKSGRILGLSTLIHWMLKNHGKCGITKNALIVAHKCVCEEKQIFSTQTFNALAHNPHFSISSFKVKEIRNDSEALVREIVQGVK